MVIRILEQEKAIRVALSMDRKTSHLIPTWQDIDVLQSLKAAIGPLMSLTDLSGETYVTVSAVLPLLHLIQHDILNEDDSDTELTCNIKRRIKVDLGNCYTIAKLGEQCIMILKSASFLDPRFKTKYMSAEDVNNVEAKLKLDCENLNLHFAPDSSQSPPKKKRNLVSLFKDVEEKQKEDQEEHAVISPEQRFQEEVERYKVSARLDFEENPLSWWKVNYLELPTLSQLARKYLCICATSSSSERLFSTAGNIATPLRSHLTPDKVEMLTFLSKNL